MRSSDETAADSDDEALVVVFPDSAGHVDRGMRRLALQISAAAKLSVPVLSELDNSSTTEFLQFAVTEATSCRT